MSTRTLSVRIPAGVREGQYIRLGGQGMPGYGGGENGDLYLEVRFKPHARYRAEGRDLYMSLPVAPWEAALGAQVEAPTPGARWKCPSPRVGQWPQAAAARPRHTWRSAWRPVSGVELALPPADTEAAKQAYRKMQQDLPFNPRRHLGA